jgi:hypothetical protein
MELITDFKSLLSVIEPGTQHVKDAKAAHEKVREELEADEESKEAHKDTFLSGSYARSTAILDIKDVDVICLLDIDHTITSPDLVLAWVHSILARLYKETKRQGRSVRVTAAKSVWLDIVPGVPMSTNDGPIRIPDRDAHEWVATHPKGQVAAEVSQNKATNGYYVQVVKLMKYWRDSLPTESSRAKSYILESLVHRTIGYPTSHATGVVNVLEGIERTYGSFRNTNSVPSIPDPGYATVNVAKRWATTDFDSFMNKVQTAASTARAALDESDEAKSRQLWRQLFGSSFGK